MTLRFSCFKNQYRTFVTYGYLIAIKGAKQVFGFGSGKVGRHEQPFAVEYVAYKTVCTRTLPHDVKTSAEKPMSPATAIEFGRLGGLGVLNLEGLWTRYADPGPILAELNAQ